MSRVFAVRACSVLSTVHQPMYCHYATTPRCEKTQRTFLLKSIQDPLIWFKVLIVYFGFTWGYYFLDSCYCSSKLCGMGLPERCWQRNSQTRFFIWDTNHKHHTYTRSNNHRMQFLRTWTHLQHKHQHGKKQTNGMQNYASAGTAFGKINTIQRSKAIQHKKHSEHNSACKMNQWTIKVLGDWGIQILTTWTVCQPQSSVRTATKSPTFVKLLLKCAF